MGDQSILPLSRAATTPLVGRARELAHLREHVASALAGCGGLVLVGGEAGSGKTTLAEVALAEAERLGALVLVGRCYDLSETPPYGPWAEICTVLPGGGDLPIPLGTGGEVASQVVLFA